MRVGRGRERWAHMVATDGLPELQAFARRLGLEDWWLQRHRVPHYDVRPRQHRLALIRGALLVATRSLVRLAAVPICARDGCERPSVIAVSYDLDLPAMHYCSALCQALDDWTMGGGTRQGIGASAATAAEGGAAEPR